MFALARGSLALVFVASLIACSSSSKDAPAGGGAADASAGDDAGGSGVTLTADTFELALAKSDCRFEAKCGFLAASEEAACEADAVAQASAAKPYANVAAAHDGRLAFDPTAAQKCLDASAAKGCFDQLGPSTICAAVYAGLVASGGACEADVECESGVCDRGGTLHDGCPGTCKPFTATSATCGTGHAACAPSDYCDTNTTSTCKPRSAVGKSCDADVGPFCTAGLFCVGTTCVAPGGGAGVACASGLFGSSCDDALACDASGHCATRQAAGGSCASFDACDDGLDCVGIVIDSNTGAVTKNGACSPYLDVGAACDVTLAESGCPGGTTCDATSHACVKVGVAGAACNTGSLYCRDGFYCDGTPGKCQPIVPFGGACEAPVSGADVSCYPSTQCDATTKTCSLVCD